MHTGSSASPFAVDIASASSSGTTPDRVLSYIVGCGEHSLHRRVENIFFPFPRENSRVYCDNLPLSIVERLLSLIAKNPDEVFLSSIIKRESEIGMYAIGRVRRDDSVGGKMGVGKATT